MRSFLKVYLDELVFALSWEKIKKIIPAKVYTKLEVEKKWIWGICYEDGQIFPIIDLHKKNSTRMTKTAPLFIIYRLNGGEVAFLATLTDKFIQIDDTQEDELNSCKDEVRMIEIEGEQIVFPFFH